MKGNSFGGLPSLKSKAKTPGRVANRRNFGWVDTTTKSASEVNIGMSRTVRSVPTWKAAANGCRISIPLAISVGIYGVIFGLLAKQNHFSQLQAIAMSLLVFAGTAQFAGLNISLHPISPVALVAVVLQTLVINSRHLLMGMSFSSLFMGSNKFVKCFLAFVLSDESWALALKKSEDGATDPGFLLGCGVTIYAFWSFATFVGVAIHDVFSDQLDPKVWGLDAILPCVLVMLLVPRWKGRSTALPWLAAGLASILSDRWLPTGWNVLLGSLVGITISSCQTGGEL